MGASKSILEKYETGLPTFLRLFEMKKPELLVILREICGDRVTKETLEDSSIVYKEIRNDEPDSITVASWDKISISPFGINFQREHSTAENIVEFNQFFKLPE